MSEKSWKGKALGLLDYALDKGDKVLDIGANMAEVVVSLRKPTPLNLATVAMKLGSEFRDVRLVSSNEHFRPNWTRLQSESAANSTFHILSAMADPARVPRTERYDRGFIFNIEGLEVGAGVHMDESKLSCHSIWAKNDQIEETKRLLGTCMWKSIQTQHAVLSTEHPGFALEDDDLSKVMPSKLAQSILTNVHRYNEKGFNRSILLKGPPGTGKTSLMQYISKQMDGRSLRLQARSLRRLEGMSMRDIIKMLSPDVILIDDFDRYMGGNTAIQGLFDGLESINENVKLFMVSVNDVVKIPKALRRPGRFDEVIEITNLDKEIVDQYLEGVPEQHAKRMRTLPIAYLVELRKRIEVLGMEDAITCIQEMVERDAEVERALTNRGPSYTDDEDEDE